MRDSRGRGSDTPLVPLRDRIGWFTGLRIGLLGAAVAMGTFLPAPRRTPHVDVAQAVAIYAATTVLVYATAWAGRGVARTMLNTALLLDGLALGVAVHILGGVHGPAVGLVVAHAAGVSLLVSFRTGVKVALWHSIVIAGLLYVESTDLLGWGNGSPHLIQAQDQRAYVQFLAVLWSTTVATSTFAAANERELRRRRYDAELLQRLLAEMHRLREPEAIAAALTTLACDGLLARRALVLSSPPPERSHARRLRVLAASPGPGADRTTLSEAQSGAAPTELGPTSLLRTATDVIAPVLVRRLDEERDPWLARRLPRARGVVVIHLPMGEADQGWLVMEFGPRRSRAVERRLLSTATQAAAHGALALSRAHALARLHTAASTDTLTGLANRRTFETTFAAAIDTARSVEGSLAVAIIDLDHFKAINDTHGHQVGDAVLTHAAHALSAAARRGDTVARYGGEEFVAILPGSNTADALQIADRLRLAIAASHPSLAVTASVGVAVLGSQHASPQALLRAADLALYRAKENGRNRCVLVAVDDTHDRSRPVEFREVAAHSGPTNAGMPVSSADTDIAHHRIPTQPGARQAQHDP